MAGEGDEPCQGDREYQYRECHLKMGKEYSHISTQPKESTTNTEQSMISLFDSGKTENRRTGCL